MITYFKVTLLHFHGRFLAEPVLALLLSEADLGMFSRTGAPTKKGPPQEDRQIFAT